MIYILNIALFLFYFFINVFFFNQFKSILKFILLSVSYLSICFFILRESEYLILYFILHILFIISFKFFSYLFIETSPTLYLSEILFNKLSKEEAKKEFLKKVFIDKYIDNLEKQHFIKISNNKIILNKSGIIFFKFFFYTFRFMFK